VISTGRHQKIGSVFDRDGQFLARQMVKLSSLHDEGEPDDALRLAPVAFDRARQCGSNGRINGDFIIELFVWAGSRARWNDRVGKKYYSVGLRCGGDVDLARRTTTIVVIVSEKTWAYALHVTIYRNFTTNVTVPLGNNDATVL
jgi:hypothetical protein